MAVNLEKEVGRQVQLWEIKRRLEAEGKRPAPAEFGGVPCGPCLLVSREPGSQGDEVARGAGTRLGWQVYDREIVEEIARRTHLRRQVFESVDEKARSAWKALRAALSRDDVGPEAYHFMLEQVLKALGHQGDVVIIGRGAHYVLPACCALRVRVTAPRAVRAERLAAAQSLSFEEAERELDRRDAEQVAYFRRTFDKDAANPLDYDLLVNTGDLTVEAGIEAVLGGLRGKLGVRVG